ncbi:MAG: cell division protein FtsA [Chitinivibrionia bacterium]|nr:cell division protein FtsA [Chitinivibrionia bacterium]
MISADKTIMAIDIGSQWVKVAVAQQDEDTELRIPAYGICASEGFVNGYVINVEKLEKCIYSAINEVQQNLGEDIDPSRMPIYYSISGDKVSGKNTDTEMRHIHDVDYTTKIGKVSDEDIRWLKNSLEASILPTGIKKIAMITQCFQIDEREAIENPVGLYGQEIKAAGHLVTDAQSHIADLENVITKAFAIDNDGIDDDIKLIPVAASLASSLSVLSEEEKEAGVALVDIGEGCSDLSVFYNKYPVLTWCSAKAGGIITKDIKTFLNIGVGDAEKIKKEYAYATPTKAGSKETIEVPSITGGSGTLKLETLAAWVYPVAKFLFENVNNVLDSNIEDTTYKGIISQNGIVITGGTANLKEISSVAMEVLQLPVKIGKPNIVKISEFPNMNTDPSFSTLLGLCIYGMRNYEFSTGTKRKKRAGGSRTKSKNPAGNLIKDFWETLKNIQIS